MQRYPEGLGRGCKITFVTWIYSGTERDFYRFIFSILLCLCFFGAGLVLKRMKMRTQIPFGPFISPRGNMLHVGHVYAKIERIEM